MTDSYKRIAVLYSDTKPNDNVKKALDNFFIGKNIEVFLTDSALEATEADVCIVDGYKGHLSTNILECTKFLKIHYSLLPAFDTDSPEEDAFNAGVIVSGVTVCYINDDGTNGKILAQYPVFIDSIDGIDDFKRELYKVAAKLLPFVVESVLNDVVFNFGMLLKPQGCREDGCGGGCHGNCDGCSE